MAKSLKSKWVRKQKAIKRIRYGKKELIRLETMLKEAEEDAKSGRHSSQHFKVVSKVTEDEKMEEEPRVYNEVTKKDQFGNYPPWMKRHQIKLLKRKKTNKPKRKTKHNRK